VSDDVVGNMSVQYSSPRLRMPFDPIDEGSGYIDNTECHLTQETRVRNVLDDGVGNIRCQYCPPQHRVAV